MTYTCAMVCSIQLDGGNVASSNTCWTDASSTAQPAVVRSALSQTALGPLTFGVTLQVSRPFPKSYEPPARGAEEPSSGSNSSRV